MKRRVVIVGTAGSHKDAPYKDPSAEIWGLNDGYGVKGGMPRIDAWYDIHPPDHFHFVGKNPDGTVPALYAHHVPYGYYVRPEKHLEWLATQPFPVWLHPEHA